MISGAGEVQCQGSGKHGGGHQGVRHRQKGAADSSRQPALRVLSVLRQRFDTVIGAQDFFQVAAGVVFQLQPDTVRVVHSCQPVVAVPLEGDTVAGGVAHPAQHIHPVCGRMRQTQVILIPR